MVDMDKPHFQNAVGGATGWETIDDLLALCDACEYWSDDFVESAERNAKKHHIRGMIKSLKGDDAFPIWASVEIVDSLGNAQRVYKQESLFDANDYQQLIDYHVGRSGHHHRMATKYMERCRSRLDVQLALPLG